MTPRLLAGFACAFCLVSLVGACSSDAGPGSPGASGSSGVPTSGGGGSAGAPVGGTGGSVATGGGGSGTGIAGSGGSASGSGSGGAAGGNAGAGGGGAGTAGGGAAGAGGGGAGVACPADKSFCSGFEDTTLPAGAILKVNGPPVDPKDWLNEFEIDTTVFKSGKSSLKLKEMPGSGSAYQMLAVPAPAGGKFWARFYIRQDAMDIGLVDHNVFAGAASGDDPNAQPMIEFAEDAGVSFNTSDKVVSPPGYGRVNGTPMPYTLAKGQWHCIELSYDGVARTQQLYVNGKLLIDATNYPDAVSKPLTFFKFGFNKLHGPARVIWYDDVAVGPTRPGCL